MAYKIALALIKGGSTFEGRVETTFDLSELSDDLGEDNALFIDYRGKSLNKFVINGTTITPKDYEKSVFINHRIYVPKNL